MKNQDVFSDTKKKESKPMSKEAKKFWLSVIPWWGSAFIISFGGFLLFDIMTPARPVSFTYEGILMFMGICAGIGWVIHGTGFLLVRVK